jgi:hypothetical protein
MLVMQHWYSTEGDEAEVTLLVPELYVDATNYSMIEGSNSDRVICTNSWHSEIR